MGITTVLILATVECLYRAALTHLPLLPPHMNRAAVPMLLARATWAAEEGSMALQVRRLVPWTLLRVLTRILRARKGHAASSGGFRLANQAALVWTLKVEKPELKRTGGTAALPSLSRRPSLLEGNGGVERQGLRGLLSLAFCWRRSEKLPLPLGGRTSAATRSRFAAASGLAGSPSWASFS